MAYRIRQGRPFNRPPTGLGFTETYLYLLDHLNEPVRPFLRIDTPQLTSFRYSGLQAEPCHREGARRSLPSPR